MVVSELAKRRTKAPKSNVFSKILVAGVLACVLCPTSLVLARNYSSNSYSFEFVDDSNSQTVAGDTITGIRIIYETSETGYHTFDKVFSIGASGSSSSSSDPNAIYSLSANGRTITYTKGNGATGTITTQDTDTTYSAGNGLSLNGTTFSAKAGTNVTVNANGISVTGNGTVASGNTGLIDGGKLYTEVRPADNGNYVMS